MNNLTSKDKDGKIMVEGTFKICSIAEHCYGWDCPKSCIINRMIERLYELEHGRTTDIQEQEGAFDNRN